MSLSKYSTVTSFEPYPGNLTHRSAYSRMETQTRAKALTSFVNVQDNLGLSGHLLSETDYAKLPGAMIPRYMALTRPKFAPGFAAEVLSGNSGISQTHVQSNSSSTTSSLVPSNQEPKMSAIDVSLYNQAYSAWLEEQNVLNSFRTKFYFSMDPAAQLVAAPDEDFAQATLSEMWARLKTEFGTLSMADINTKTEKLTSPLSSHGTIEALLDVHAAVHRLRLANKQPISEIDKITYLRKAIEPCGIFSIPIELFMADFTIESTTHTYARLALACKKFSKNTTSATDPIGSANMAKRKFQEYSPAQVDLEKSESSFDQKVADAVDKRFALMAASKIKEKKKDAKLHYCWTHGSRSNHPSGRCQKPNLPHHQWNSTEANKMGGSNHVYGKGKGPGPGSQSGGKTTNA